mgnify:FL=1
MMCSMKRLRQHTMPAWLAMWALVLQSWWPALSHAMVDATQNQWVEVCTQTGMAWVRAQPSSTDQSAVPPSDTTPKPCQWCLTHGSLGHGLISELPTWQLLTLHESIPAAVLVSTASSKWNWRQQARAPPATH